MTFALALSLPESRTLRLRVQVGDVVLEDDACDIFNDPLAELAAAAVAVAAGASAVARFFSDQGWSFDLVFEADGASVAVELRARTARARAIAAGAEVVQVVHAAFAPLVEAAPRSGPLDGWALPWASLRELVSDARPRVFPAPWQASTSAERVVAEASLEIGPRHALWGVGLTCIARRLDDDRALFALATGRDAFAVVRLTWSGAREAPPLPATTFFPTWDRVLAALAS